MTLATRYLGPAVLFAQQDASRIPREAVGETVNTVVASRAADGFELHLMATGDKIDLLAIDLCAAVAASAEGEKALREYFADLGARGEAMGDFPEITRVSPDEHLAAQVAVAIQTGLSRLLGAMAERNSALVRALAAVRREHEVLQDAFASLEEAVWTANLPEKPAFTLAPTDRVLSVRDNWPPADSLLQRIPVSSRAVSSIDLCFFVNDENSKGEFEIALKSLEDGIEAGNWRVPFERIVPGWTQFHLDQALMGKPRTLEVSVKANVSEGEAPGIVLAAPSPLEDAVYRTSSGKSGDSPLAFRVWRSLPGLRSRPSIHGIQTAGGEGRSSVRFLAAQQLASAQALGRAAKSSPPLVQYMQDVGELQVHPAAKGLVSAYLERAIPPFASRVSASVVTRHPEADVVDYALLAIPGREAIESTLSKLAKANGPIDGFSGWTAIAPMEQSQISLHFGKPPRVALDLILVTRAHERQAANSLDWRSLLKRGAERGHTRYAWARFFDIEVELAQQ
jgi:hypothetical protein